MDLEIAQRCRPLLEELGLKTVDETMRVTPLSGGVSSDIARVDVGGRSFCVKFALEKLKVDEEWRAPIGRNRAEYAWLEFARRIAPRSIPELFGRSEAAGGFIMEMIAGADVYLWKEALLDGRLQPYEPVGVADLVGQIHAASTAAGFDCSPFQNRDDFHALRIEPYLLFTAKRHPALASRLSSISEVLYAADTVLVHGDVSPKNILFRKQAPILLDAECATMGDACFDVAFCLNHLLLKAVHRSVDCSRFLDAAGIFWRIYAQHINWEDPVGLENRMSALLPALMLARVDGKSPVEYLSQEGHETVRSIAIPLIKKPQERLAAVFEAVGRGVAG
ncbi:MAG: aminoglycoside phosphotransferase family protein [Pseudomonadota bacterium]